MTANIALAFAVSVLLFPRALFGVLGRTGVVLVHEIAELIVIANGVRTARRPRLARSMSAFAARQSALMAARIWARQPAAP